MKINSISELWNAILEDSKNYISETPFNAFVRDILPVKMMDGTLYLGVGSIFMKQCVDTLYKETLEKCCTNIMGVPLSIEITVVQNDEIGSDAIDLKKTSIESIYTFNNFVVGSSNKFAHAASLAVANNPSFAYNPLVIYGSSGVGKTHLMLAIKNYINEHSPSLKTEFIRCEDFTNALIDAVQTNTTGIFHQRFRTVDVLLIDDIQFIAGKTSTEEEFFNTFNALYEQNKQIVVTSDRPPKDMPTLSERIKSRLEAGLMADVNPPDFETRVGIINNKAAQMNIKIPENIVYYIAEQIKTNTRQLEGVVKKLQACIQLTNETITIALVQNFIQEVVRDMVPDPITIERIIDEVSRTYSVSKDDILSKSKTAEIALARQVAIYISWKVLNISYSDIGRSFDKNHTTVLYTIKKMTETIEADPYQKKLVNDIISNLKA